MFAGMADRAAGLAAVRAYNDWVVEEWCAAAPERFIPCQVPWLADPADAAVEIRRNAAQGFKAVSFSENPSALGYPSIYTGHWDEYFAACEETDTVLCLHVGSSGAVTCTTVDAPLAVPVALFPLNGIQALVDWVFSKVLLRFPGLKITLSEAGASWVPMAIERIRRAHRQRESADYWTAADPDPEEIVHRNFWFASIEDPSAFRLLDVIGEDKVMVESDYPHCDTSWPETQDLVRGQLAHLPLETVRKVCYENAAALYRHPLPSDEFVGGTELGAAATAVAT
jgi:predicted TIM-barrel fold metal-dependent hydrolase